MSNENGRRTTIPLVTDGYLGANLTSGALNILAFQDFSIHAFISAGTPSGTLTLEFSNEENNLTDGYFTQVNSQVSAGISNAIGTHWVTAASIKNFPVANAFTAQTLTSGSPAENMWNFQSVGFKWVRLVYTASLGTGTLQARFCGKRNKTSNT